MIYILQFHIHLGYTGLMERPPLPIRDCKRGHYHEATEEYWMWFINKNRSNGGNWGCRECSRERISLSRHGEIRPRVISTKKVRLAVWGKCGHIRNKETTYTTPSSRYSQEVGEESCRICRARNSQVRYNNLRQDFLAYTWGLIGARYRKAAKRAAESRSNLERDIADGRI